MDMIFQPLEDFLVVRWIGEIDIKDMHHAFVMALRDCGLCFRGSSSRARRIEKKNMIERARGKKGKDRAWLFLLINQSLKIGIVKARKCKKDIHFRDDLYLEASG